MTGLDYETRDCIRDLCEAVATLTSRCVPLVGTTMAEDIIGKTLRLSKRMDSLDGHEALEDVD
jgi:hypothetical protein